MDTLAVLPDELLEHILLGVGSSPVDLVRAASVCKRWRRIVADAGFLRRICALHHVPPVAGSYYNSTLKPRDKSRPLPSFVPCSTTAINSRHFSLDFLPDADVMPAVWSAIGSRGSLLLLHGLDRKDKYSWRVDYSDMVVCEPVTRRYVRISPATAFEGHSIFFAYLCDGDGSGIGIDNFKVLVLCPLDRCVGVLSSDGTCRKTSIDGTAGMIFLGVTEAFLYCYKGGRTVVAVDRRRSTDVSCFELPDIEDWEHSFYNLTMTTGHGDGGDEDRIVFADKDGTIKVFARTDHDGVTESLALEKIISFAQVIPDLRQQRLCIRRPIYRTPMIIVSPGVQSLERFCVNVETLEVEDVTDRDGLYPVNYPCKLPWPPVLRACTVDELL